MNDANALLRSWQRLSTKPFGTRLFSFVLGRQVRYTGSIRPHIRELAPGHARVELRDRRKVRNHLRSIHAVALMNLGEATGGLALMAGLSDADRGIVTQLSMRYLKKARGTLLGRADFPMPPLGFTGPYTTETELVDAEGDVVAVCTAEWTLGPKPQR